MEKSNKTKVILNLLFGNYKLIVPAIVMIAIIIGIVAWLNRDNNIKIGNSNDDIEISDAQITSIRNIGEWEFMSINDEEIVDTIRRGFFGDDQLARIYYGTVRLGVNLHEAAEDWLTIDKDTIIAKVPKIKVLDEDSVSAFLLNRSSDLWASNGRQPTTRLYTNKHTGKCARDVLHLRI